MECMPELLAQGTVWTTADLTDRVGTSRGADRPLTKIVRRTEDLLIGGSITNDHMIDRCPVGLGRGNAVQVNDTARPRVEASPFTQFLNEWRGKLRCNNEHENEQKYLHRR